MFAEPVRHTDSTETFALYYATDFMPGEFYPLNESQSGLHKSQTDYICRKVWYSGKNGAELDGLPQLTELQDIIFPLAFMKCKAENVHAWKLLRIRRKAGEAVADTGSITRVIQNNPVKP
ncbi:MAG: hypothetical protein V4543_17790 [Bacteroidota bacterium]